MHPRYLPVALLLCGLVGIALIVFSSRPTGERGAELGAQAATATATTTPAATATATPTPEPTPTVTATPTPTPIPVRRAVVSFSGDVLSHAPVFNQARNLGNGDDWPYDYRPMFAQVAPRLSAADLALCVLETPLSPDNTNLTGYPTFNAPRELADALAESGFDGCSTASNHSYDRAVTGVESTLTELDRAGLGHAGMARTEAEAAIPKTYNVNGITIAHLSWTYGLNGFILPSDKPWLVDVTEQDAVLAEAAVAREAGADVVILSIQWGNEYQVSPSPNQEELAEIFTASPDIDAIVGNHAHVIQPITTINGKPVVFGVGNFLSNQSNWCCPAGSQDGVMVELEIVGTAVDGYTVAGITIVPTWVDRTSYTIVPVVETLANPDLDDGTRVTLEASLARTLAAVTKLGSEFEVQ